MPKPRPILQPFMEKVDTSGGPDACHPWTAARNRYGYGVFQLDQRRGTTAHRWLLGYLRGEPLRWDDEVREAALHHCDNPACVNPRHLYVGTLAQNMQDMIDRRRPHPATLRKYSDRCHKGHLYTPDNTYVTRSGHRRCRKCDRDGQRRRSAMRK